jgi:hypothetical protein
MRCDECIVKRFNRGGYGQNPCVEVSIDGDGTWDECAPKWRREYKPMPLNECTMCGAPTDNLTKKCKSCFKEYMHNAIKEKLRAKSKPNVFDENKQLKAEVADLRKALTELKEFVDAEIKMIDIEAPAAQSARALTAYKARQGLCYEISEHLGATLDGEVETSET